MLGKNIKYLWMTVRNQNYIHEETESKLTFSNACYTSVQNSISSHLLTIINVQTTHLFIQQYTLCVALCKYETSSLALYMDCVLQHGAVEDIWI